MTWPESIQCMVPYFMYQLIEEITEQARKSKFIDQASGVSARDFHSRISAR